VVHCDNFLQRFVNRRLYTTLLERTKNLLGRNISDQLVLRERTAAEPAESGVETPATRVISRKNFRSGRGSPAVQVDTDFSFT
jgi:hypothetical protein